MGMEQAVKTNDRRKILVATRDKIAETMDKTDSGRDIAALSKRLMEVCAELDAIGDGNKRNTKLAVLQEKAAKRNAG